MRKIFLAALMVCSLFHVGCVSSNLKKPKTTADTITMHDDADEMKEELLSKIPIGTPLEKAQELLEQNGFECYKGRENERHQESASGTPYLHARKEVSDGSWVSAVWQVNLNYDDIGVTAIRVTSGYIGP